MFVDESENPTFVEAQMSNLNASEAIMMFLGWLTCRKESVTFGATEDAFKAVQIHKEYCELRDLDAIRPGFPNPVNMLSSQIREVMNDYFDSQNVNPFAEASLESIKPSHYEDIFKVLLVVSPRGSNQDPKEYLKGISKIAKIATGAMLEGSL